MLYIACMHKDIWIYIHIIAVNNNYRQTHYGTHEQTPSLIHIHIHAVSIYIYTCVNSMSYDKYQSCFLSKSIQACIIKTDTIKTLRHNHHLTHTTSHHTTAQQHHRQTNRQTIEEHPSREPNRRRFVDS